MILHSRFIVSYPYSAIPKLIKKLEKEGRLDLLEAVKQRYATMTPDQRIRVIHYEPRTAGSAEGN